MILACCTSGKTIVWANSLGDNFNTFYDIHNPYE